MEYQETVEENFDIVMLAIASFAVASMVGAVTPFGIFPDYNAGAGLFSLGDVFTTISGTGITYAAALAIAGGVGIYVTNVGVRGPEALQEEFDSVELGLAAGVVALPVLVAFDVFGLSGVVSASVARQAIVLVTYTGGALVLSGRSS